MSAYVPLWVKSHHSFLEGASSPEELVDAAIHLGLDSIALTDRNGVYGLARAYIHAREKPLRVIAGTELSLRQPGLDARVLILPTDREAYARMCKLVSLAHTRGDKGDAWADAAEVEAHAKGCVLLTPDYDALEPLQHTELYAYCARHLGPGEREYERELRDEARRVGAGAVGGNEVLYHHKGRRDLQDVAACVRAGVSLREAGRVLRGNAEHHLVPADAMHSRFEDAPELLAMSIAIAERCTFGLDQLRYRYPEESLPDGQTEQSWLSVLTWRGAEGRYPDGVPDEVRTQLERELDVIKRLDYGGYFLTMHEIVEYCRLNKILCQGRGSAANSAVCFCLGITAIDPVRMELLFERFLSVERAEPPDIDLDIEHERREEVIQHVYERYGRRRAAMVSNVIRYRAKSAVRDVGKALGVPRTDLDAMARLLSHWGGDVFDDELARDSGLDPNAPATHHLLRLASELQDAPRHQSIHPGGFLLGQRPVDEIVPIEPATMEGRTVIQWDKYDVEALGLFKVDLLGLGALTCIRKCFDMLRTNYQRDLEIATVPADDEATYDLCSAGDTVGVFQIESRAQMAMLPRLKPRTFYDLVIEVAIVRPGPIQGDMVHPYLRRRDGLEPIDVPHPKLERVLRKTMGVPIFQEQVMKVAVAVADYTPGEADQLRRDMAAWKSSGKIERHHDRMIRSMVENGIPLEFAERVFSQIRGFGEYGFPESHAASFALLAYVTAWLRCHHPDVFTCGLLNSQPMGFYSPATLVEDAKRKGIEVRPLDVAVSEWDHVLEGPPRSGRHAIRMGMRLVKGLGEAEGDKILRARAQQPFVSLADFVRRTRIPERSLISLAEAGAFDGFGVKRRDALWQIRGLVRTIDASLPHVEAQTQMSFADLATEEAVLWDYRSSQHSPRGHPMERFRTELSRTGHPTAKQLNELPHGSKTDFVGMIICRQRPMTASGVTFFTMEDETGFANIVVWKRVFEEHQVLAKTATVFGLSGEVQKADGVTHLIAEKLWALPDSLRDLEREIAHRSRDFH